MTALTKDKAVSSRKGEGWGDPVAAGVTIHRGAMVALDASGNAVPGGHANAALTRGVALDDHADNADGAAGEATIETRNGEAYLFANSAGADEITRAQIGATVYAADDQTVARTDDSGGRIAAGTCVQIAANGVWVAL